MDQLACCERRSGVWTERPESEACWTKPVRIVSMTVADAVRGCSRTQEFRRHPQQRSALRRRQWIGQ